MAAVPRLPDCTRRNVRFFKAVQVLVDETINQLPNSVSQGVLITSPINMLT